MKFRIVKEGMIRETGRRWPRLIMQMKRKGQSLLEFAIAIPVLVIIIIGMFDLGRVFFSVITITNVAREGARYLARNPVDNLNALHGCTAGRICSDNNCCDPVFCCSTAFCCTVRAAANETANTFLNLTSANVAVTRCIDTQFQGCDNGTYVGVAVTYNFIPIARWMIPGLGRVLPNGIPLSRSAEMLVP